MAQRAATGYKPAMATNVLGIAGSLRAGSFNRALLRLAVELAPQGMTITPFDLIDVPLYNGDVEDRGDPAPVTALKEAIRAADGVLIATPEYNYGIPGGLKNAIDWASRPPGKSLLVGKPTAVIGASTGPGGTIRAQAALRQSLVATATPVLVGPELYVVRAHEKIDADGKVTDETTRKVLGKVLAAFATWIERFRA